MLCSCDQREGETRKKEKRRKLCSHNPKKGEGKKKEKGGKEEGKKNIKVMRTSKLDAFIESWMFFSHRDMRTENLVCLPILICAPHAQKSYLLTIF